MPAKIGSTNIGAINVGSTSIATAKKGTTTVFQKPAPPSGGASMQDVISGTWVDLDATISDSYDGTGQTWSNLVVSPFGGGVQTDFDAWLGTGSGASTDDPTFTGTVGDSGAYFNFDGGDIMTLKTISGNALAQLHDDVNTVWFALSFEKPSTSTFYNLFGNARRSGGVSVGVALTIDNRTTKRFFSRYYVTDSSNNSWQRNSAVNYSDPGNNTPILAVFVIRKKATDMEIVHFINGTKYTANYSFTSSEPDPIIADNPPNWAMQFGAAPDSSGAPEKVVPNGFKIKAFSAGLGDLSDTDAADILAEYETRHGVTYS